MNNISKMVKMFSDATLVDSDDAVVEQVADINSIPEEVLIEILDKLDRPTRISAIRTCRRWRGIMLTDTRFAKYNQLNLDGGVALEMDSGPVHMFMESNRKFGILRLGDVRYGQDLDEFWKRMAQTVQHLILKEFLPYSIRSYFLAEIISKFTRLQILEFEKYHVDREIIRVEKKLLPYTYKWPSVQILKLGDSKFEPENYDFFAVMLPNLREIYFEKLLYSDELVKRYASKIKRLNIGDNVGSSNLMYRNNQSPALSKLTHLEVVLDNQYELLVEFIKNHPLLEDVTVTSHGFPRDPIPKLHKLQLDLSLVINSFTPLHNFPELRELQVKLSNYDSNCFFGHEIIESPNLESLTLCNFSSGDCQKCQKFMFKSFPNLKSFSSESCFVSSADIIKLISKYSSGLEHLTNKYFVTENFCLNSSLLKWKQMNNLKTCCLNPVGTLTEEGIFNFCNSCPAIEELQLCGAKNFSESMYDIVVSQLKRLRYLKVEQRRPVHEISPNGLSYTIEMPNGVPVYCYRFY